LGGLSRWCTCNYEGKIRENWYEKYEEIKVWMFWKKGEVGVVGD